MINIRTLRKLKHNDGLTLKNGKITTYKLGYQVGLRGYQTDNIHEVRTYMKLYNGNCGIWYYNNTYYIDESYHFTTLRSARAVGNFSNQISIYDWKHDQVIFL